MKNLISLGVFLLILLSVQVNAQEQSVLKIRPTGRILMDGGLFHSDNKNFVDGVAIPDARIGGDGGRGASIIFKVDTGLRTLMDFKYKKKYVGEPGADGRKKDKQEKTVKI